MIIIDFASQLFNPFIYKKKPENLFPAVKVKFEFVFR